LHLMCFNTLTGISSNYSQFWWRLLPDLYLISTLMHSCVYFSFPLFFSVYIHKTLVDNFSRFNLDSKGNDRGRLQEFLTNLPYTNR
jgi:hypothetical protein